MTQPTLATKKKLEAALKSALKLAIQEMKATQSGYSEEALRYIVMNELSHQKYWGTFPNQGGNSNKLLFEQEYNVLKVKKKRFKPDIISKNEDDHLLAVELKIKNNILDVKKCMEYISESKGNVHFKLAAAIYGIPQPPAGSSNFLSSQIKRAAKNGIDITNGRLLVAFIEWEPKRNEKGVTSQNHNIRLEWIA
jgi:hypothetical protein